MGVEGLWSVLGPCCETLPLDELKGWRIAVDVSPWLVGKQRQFGCPDRLARPHWTLQPHVDYLCNNLAALVRVGAVPVVVCDGAPPALKAAELGRRRAMAAAKRYRMAVPRGPNGGGGGGGSDDDDNPSSQRSAGSASSQCGPLGDPREEFEQLKRDAVAVARALGVGVVELAEGEAEAYCGQMCLDGAADAVLTPDGDALLFGATVVIRSIELGDLRGRNVKIVRASRVQNDLGLGREHLVAYSLFAGSDYVPVKVRGYGVQHILALLRSRPFESRRPLERLMEWVEVADDRALSPAAEEQLVLTLVRTAEALQRVAPAGRSRDDSAHSIAELGWSACSRLAGVFGLPAPAESLAVVRGALADLQTQHEEASGVGSFWRLPDVAAAVKGPTVPDRRDEAVVASARSAFLGVHSREEVLLVLLAYLDPCLRVRRRHLAGRVDLSALVPLMARAGWRREKSTRCGSTAQLHADLHANDFRLYRPTHLVTKSKESLEVHWIRVAGAGAGAGVASDAFGQAERWTTVESEAVLRRAVPDMVETALRLYPRRGRPRGKPQLQEGADRVSPRASGEDELGGGRLAAGLRPAPAQRRPRPSRALASEPAAGSAVVERSSASSSSAARPSLASRRAAGGNGNAKKKKTKEKDHGEKHRGTRPGLEDEDEGDSFEDEEDERVEERTKVGTERRRRTTTTTKKKKKKKRELDEAVGPVQRDAQNDQPLANSSLVRGGTPRTVCENRHGRSPREVIAIDDSSSSSDDIDSQTAERGEEDEGDSSGTDWGTVWSQTSTRMCYVCGEPFLTLEIEAHQERCGGRVVHVHSNAQVAGPGNLQLAMGAAGVPAAAESAQFRLQDREQDACDLDEDDEDCG